MIDKCLQIRHANKLSSHRYVCMYVRPKQDGGKKGDFESGTLMRIAPEEACSLHPRGCCMMGRGKGEEEVPWRVLGILALARWATGPWEVVVAAASGLSSRRREPEAASALRQVETGDSG